MARLRGKGPAATKLARDDDGMPIPVMPWGKLHTLAPSDATAARNATPISPECGIVSLVAIGGPAHFRQGDASVVATSSDVYLPEGEWHELPVFEGDASSYVSVIAAAGAGTISVQICERQ